MALVHILFSACFGCGAFVTVWSLCAVYINALSYLLIHPKIWYRALSRAEIYFLPLNPVWRTLNLCPFVLFFSLVSTSKMIEWTWISAWARELRKYTYTRAAFSCVHLRSVCHLSYIEASHHVVDPVHMMLLNTDAIAGRLIRRDVK